MNNLSTNILHFKPYVVCETGIRHMSHDATIINIKSIKEANLTELINDLAAGRIAAVVIEGAIPTAICDAMQQAMSAMQFDAYGVEPRFSKIGTPLYEAVAQSNGTADYFANAVPDTWDLQESIAPLMTPASWIRLILDMHWPAGSNLLRLDGKVCPFGLLRMLRDGGEVEAHQDDSHWDYPNTKLVNARTNLSWLSYLSDFEGGELVIYPVQLLDKATMDSHRIPGHPYGLDRTLLPPPRAIIKPTKGTTILFNARFVHRVNPVHVGSGTRITQSGFVLVGNNNEPLGLYH